MSGRALDLFCGAGGASKGLADAGYDVIGVDIAPQPSYPFEFVQADALEFDVDGFDLVWASPPCQRFIRSGLVNKKNAPDLVAPIRARLAGLECRTVIENVPGAPLRPDLMLCGSMFDLPIRRHRIFEIDYWHQILTPPCDHSEPAVGVYGHPHGRKGAWPGMLPGSLETWRAAMGIDWMSARELSQAIPPAYSAFIAAAAHRQ